MADMRLIVAGAGGRMGRTLVKAIAETKGLVLAGALEGEGSALLGQDAGVLAGLPANNIKLGTDAKALLANADGIIDFTVPKASTALAALTARQGAHRRHHRSFGRRGGQDQGVRQERGRSSSPAT